MVTIPLPIEAAAIHGSDASPQIKRISATNNPAHNVLAFDAATIEAVWWKFIATGYSSGNLTLDLYWLSESATSGAVVWGGQISAVTPESDTENMLQATPGGEQTVTDSHLGTTAQRLMKASLTISNLDSLAAGDLVTLKLRRVADNGSDTLASDAILVAASVSYSDS